ncbi:MAG: DUF3800 domain-containing protein [Thermaerobacter sp.]|nr:DUF3800 domain-containing protein [Thermaerobacter sp.]
MKQTWLAFFDDSGSARPETAEGFFCLGMVVVPAGEVPTMSDGWRELIGRHARVSPREARTMELTSSDTYELWSRKYRGKPIDDNKPSARFSHLNEMELSRLKGVWDYISGLQDAILLGIAVHKKANWVRFRNKEWNDWNATGRGRETRKEKKDLASSLEWQIWENAFHYLLQWLQYFLDDQDGHGILIGDECTTYRHLYKFHESIAAGDDTYTNAENIINNVVFGSSYHNPGIQIADWVAYAINGWARGIEAVGQHLTEILPKFRDYPNVKGRGLVLNPDNYDWPALP